MNISALADPQQSCTAVVQLNDKPMSMQDITKTQFLLGTAEGLYTKTLIHVAANIGNLNLLEMLVNCSGLPLNTVINLRWRKFAQHIETNMSVTKSSHTPLSLALSRASYCDLIEVFVKMQSESNCVTHIDLSYTKIDYLPWELFSLSCISNLNASNNKLKNLSMLFKQFVQLRFAHLNDLNLSRNNLNNLPIEIFRLPALKSLNVSHNPLGCLPEQWWVSNCLTKLNLSQTHLTELCTHNSAHQMLRKLSASTVHDVKNKHNSNNDHGDSSNIHGCQLKKLNSSFSRLDQFPKYLACYFPNLTHLNISNNNVMSCCAINELPPLLEELDISHNKLQSKDCSIFHLSTREDALCCHLNTKPDCFLRCSHMRHKYLTNLRALNLSDNKNLQSIVLYHNDLAATASSDTTCMFFPKLRKLTLNNCGLLHTPLHLSRMNRIYHLDIGNNKMYVPREVCNLGQLSTFNYDGLPDPVVADLSNFTSVKDQQIFLLQEK